MLGQQLSVIGFAALIVTAAACGQRPGPSKVPFDQNCGNDSIDDPEVCDGPDLGGETCQSIGAGFSGTLACNTTCDDWVITACTSVLCGNSVIDAGEDCEGTNLNGQTCQSRGYQGGTLACANCAWDTSLCTSPSCGNQTAEGNEVCDGSDRRGNDCTTIGQGFTGGSLTCNGTCTGWVTTACTAATCGNQTAEGNEICDGSDRRGNDCTTIGQGFTGGSLTCNGTCNGWVTTACTAPFCGDNTAQGNEVCDGSDRRGNDCTTIGQGFIGGSLTCNGTCTGWVTTACTAPFCGNNTAEGTEACDGSDLRNNSCTTIGQGFTGGSLACNSTCTGWNTSACTGPQPVSGSLLGPCGEVRDDFTFTASADSDIRITVNTTNGTYASDLAFRLYGPSGSSVASGDDQMNCAFSPPCWKCPDSGIDQAPASGTYRVSVYVSTDPNLLNSPCCQNATRSDYVLRVLVNGVLVQATLVADNVTPVP